MLVKSWSIHETEFLLIREGSLNTKSKPYDSMVLTTSFFSALSARKSTFISPAIIIFVVIYFSEIYVSISCNFSMKISILPLGGLYIHIINIFILLMNMPTTSICLSIEYCLICESSSILISFFTKIIDPPHFLSFLQYAVPILYPDITSASNLVSFIQCSETVAMSIFSVFRYSSNSSILLFIDCTFIFRRLIYPVLLLLI